MSQPRQLDEIRFVVERANDPPFVGDDWDLAIYINETSLIEATRNVADHRGLPPDIDGIVMYSRAGVRHFLGEPALRTGATTTAGSPSYVAPVGIRAATTMWSASWWTTSASSGLPPSTEREVLDTPRSATACNSRSNVGNTRQRCKLRA
jgi:hypothetical protein